MYKQIVLKKLKKIALLLVAFLALVIINTFFLLQFNNKLLKLARHHSILAELEINDDPNKNTNDLSIAPFVWHGDRAPYPDIAQRRQLLQSFFSKYKSPLFDYVDDIINASDDNELDFRLLPAIAMQESSLCKFIPADSYNCWGWGITGGKVTRFTSYSEAIYIIAASIKKHYVDKRNLRTVSEIMTVYTPANDGRWANMVNSVFSALE